MKGIFGERFRPRKYKRNGMRCEDCGWEKPVTRVFFWIGGKAYWFCSTCIRPYRQQIMHPEPEWARGGVRP